MLPLGSELRYPGPPYGTVTGAHSFSWKLSKELRTLGDVGGREEISLYLASIIEVEKRRTMDGGCQRVQKRSK